MEFKQAWDALVRKHQVLGNPDKIIEFEPGNLKNLLSQFHGLGVSHGKSIADVPPPPSYGSASPPGKSGFMEMVLSAMQNKS